MGSALAVCAVIQSFRPVLGGAQLQLERLLPHLAAREVDVTVLARGAGAAPRREQLAGGQLRRGRLAGSSPLASVGYIAEFAAHLAVHRERYDLVHAHGALSEGAIALWASRLGVPSLVKILRAGPEGDLQTLARRPGGRLRLRRLVASAWFVAISAEVRAELEQFGVPPARIFDIPNGVDAAVFRPASAPEQRRLRERLGLPLAPPLLVYTGRLDPVKRVDVLLRALAEVPGAVLVLVGDGPDRPRLERVATQAGVRDRVRFTGTIADVSHHRRAVDLFVTPSVAEGLSNALLEALACGLPSLAAPASGVHQLLADGRGIVVEDDGAWAQTLTEVIARPDVRVIGARAAQHVRHQLTLEATADQLVAAYRHILDGRRRHGARRAGRTLRG